MLDWLPIYGEHILLLESLPPLHHDPFDRILVGQAMHEGIAVITPDEHIQRYPVDTLWSRLHPQPGFGVQLLKLHASG